MLIDSSLHKFIINFYKLKLIDSSLHKFIINFYKLKYKKKNTFFIHELMHYSNILILHNINYLLY